MSKALHVVDLNRKQIQALTTRLLVEHCPRAFRGEEPVDVEFLYEILIPDKYNITTGYADLRPFGPGVLGFSDAETKTSYVDHDLYSSVTDAGRRRCRATTGHEIGHCVVHVPILAAFHSCCRDENELALYRCEAAKLKPWQEPEWQAWEFCRNLLMPAQLVQRYIDEGKNVWDLAKLFDVNRSFVEGWLRLLGLKTRPF